MKNNSIALLLAASIVVINLPNSFGDGLPVNQNYFPGGSPVNQVLSPQTSMVTTPPQPQRIMDELDEDNLGETVNMPKTPAQMQETQPATTLYMSAPSNNYPVNNIPITTFQQQPLDGLKLQFQSAFDSNTAQNGDIFVAVASEDFWANNQLVVPKGSVVRGRIVTANKGAILNRGGEITLDFDHIVMPNGAIKPISYQMTPLSRVSTAPTSQLIGQASKQGFEAFDNITQKGIDYARAKGGGLNYLLAIPTNALVGVAAGTLITTGGTTKAIFGRAQSVTIQPGDEYEISRDQALTFLK